MTQAALKEGLRNAARFGVGLIIVVMGALMIAEGVLGWTSGSSLFFPDVNDTFVFWVGLLSVLVGSTFMSFFPGRRQFDGHGPARCPAHSTTNLYP